MYILGISCGGESGAALFKDNVLCCASNEERFSRIKLDISFPKQSLKWCLEYAEIDKRDIDLITYGFSSGCETEQQKTNWISTLIDIDKNTITGKIKQVRTITETQVDEKKYANFISEINSFFSRSIPIVRINHHTSHVAAAYIPSGMETALVITADGRGDYRSLTIGIATESGFKELYVASSWNSLGYFYGRMTKLCGFTPNRHEGKVTGLAPFGDYKKALNFVKKMIYVKDGEVHSILGNYYQPFFSNYDQSLIDEASKFSAADLAAATQFHLEEMFVELISFYLKQTKLKAIALAGGVFANISLNQAIYNIASDLEVFVYPNMGDAGICAGSCYAWLWQNQQIKPEKINSMYLGYNIDRLKMIDELKNNGIKTHKPANIYESIYETLKKGKTVGIACGQAEFGPRALGNRSILASPQSIDIIKTINKQLGRDAFMPLAPIMLQELAEEYIEFKDGNSSANGFFMTMTFKAKPILKKTAQAIVHVDGTVRPQFVTKESNEFLYNVLTYWYQKTACPALINTSFNAHEEPIVNSEIDVISAFKKGVVDSLVCPPHICLAN